MRGLLFLFTGALYPRSQAISICFKMADAPKVFRLVGS